MNFSGFFTVFLKNRNISSKIKISKVTDYAALKKNCGITSRVLNSMDPDQARHFVQTI